MKKSVFSKTMLAVLISSAVFSSGYVSASASTAILDFSRVEDFSQPLDVTKQFTDHQVFSLGSGTLTFRVKTNGGFNTLLGVSDPNSNTRYISFYTNTTTAGTAYGIEIRDNTNIIPNSELVTNPLPPSKDGFRTITYSFDKNNQKIKIYVDGVIQKTANRSKFFEDIANLSTASLGSLVRPNGRTNPFMGTIYHAGATDDVLSDDAISKLHTDIVERHKVDLTKYTEKLEFLNAKREGMGAFMSEKYEIFKPDQHGAKSYRIPGLLATKDGVVIAAIDKRNQHAADWGNIDLAIRRSSDGGLTWEDDKVVVDLATQPYRDLGAAESALVIDAVMVQNKETGRITMVFDMFPESQALFGMFSNSQASFESEGNGHVNVDGKWYRLLTDERGARYTVREGGIIYNRDGVAQDYKVVIEGDPAVSFKNLGDIIQISTNERKGNIFLRSKRDGHDSGPFNAHYTSYLWTTYSDDNGQTWSSPVDITTQVKADWMRFLGTGPGTGIQLKNGNLMIPVYFTNRDNKQSAAIIVSSDGGKTWVRGASPNDAYLSDIGGARYLNTNDYEITESQVVQLNNGDIKMFSRNRSGAVIISTSHDGGMTWDKGARLREGTLLDPYSQMSVIHYSKLIDGKEYLVFANPHANSRRNGTAWLGEVQEDGTIQWKYSTTIDPGTYAYNSLTELPNGDIGLLYEQVQGSNVQYVRFNLQELFWKENLIYRDKRNTSSPNVSLNSVEEETYYKIGDGEMVKVGQGINPAHLAVREGIATLNQQANEKGEKQAYASVIVKENGTLRLMDEDQLNLSKVALEKGTLDLNSRSFNLADKVGTENTGLRAVNLDGNIVNHGDTSATFNYQLSGVRTISGIVGDDKGVLHLSYSPSGAGENHLTLANATKLAEVNVQSDRLIYGENTHHAQSVQVAENANLELRDSSSLTVNNISLSTNAEVTINPTLNTHKSNLVGNISGAGNVIKTGQGYAKVTGNLTHSGTTSLQAGTLELDGNITESHVSVSEHAVLAGQGQINGTLTLQGSLSPTLTVQNPDDFHGKTLTLNNVNNQGGLFNLVVKNRTENMADWEHDRILIKGTLNTEVDIPVNVQLLGGALGNSDTNKDGRYDANEGLSLIQVKAAEAFRRLKINHILTSERSGHLYPLTLVSVEAGAADRAGNQVDTDGDYTDFRLQNVMLDENGQALEPVVLKSKVHTNHFALRSAGITTPTTRAAIAPRVPSYLVSNIALYNQGNLVRNVFLENIWSENKKGFYAIQSHTNSRYTTDRKFVDYGYSYKSKQNSTVFGGYIPVSEHSELHTALSFSQQKVEPKAADGYSSAKYKTVSGLIAMNNRWDSVLFNLGLGYHHHHKGKVSTVTLDDAASVKAKQLQGFAQIAYEVALGHFSITPMLGLEYQHLKTKIDDHMTNWQVNVGNYHTFTQQVGSYLGWKSRNIRLNVGAFYENINDNNPVVSISPINGHHETFHAQHLGNSLLLKASAEATLAENWKLELQLNHKHSLSDAKLKQTNVLGKVEYLF